VENLVGYAQRDLVVPLLTKADLDGGSAVGVHAANTAARSWCAEVNAATHSEISAVPKRAPVEESKVLKPLPSLRCDIGPAPVTRKVDRLSCVRFGSARYSVPTRLIGTAVAVLPDGGWLASPWPPPPTTATPRRFVSRPRPPHRSAHHCRGEPRDRRRLAPA
jgi:hypothetical protein